MNVIDCIYKRRINCILGNMKQKKMKLEHNMMRSIYAGKDMRNKA